MGSTGEGVQGLVDMFDGAPGGGARGVPMSRAVRPRLSLGQPVVRGTLLVVGGCG